MTAQGASPPSVADAQGATVPAGDPLGGALRTAAAGGVALLAASSALLVVRRWAGAATQPPEPLLLVTLGGIIVLAGWCLRFLAFRAAPEECRTRFTQAISIATSTAVCGLACGLTFAATPLAVRGVLWATVLGSELAAWLAYRAAPPNRGGDVPHRGADTAGTGTRLPSARVPRPPSDAVIVQQQIRTRSATGCETLAGDFQATFVPGQRTTSLHVAFCPPFALLPGVTVQQISGAEARLNVAQILPYGARIDVKLPREASRLTEVVVHVTAECEATGSADRIAG